jgi:predicted transcriptional regulator
MDATAQQGNSNLTDLTADIVSAYLSNNSVRPEDIATLINTVHGALSGMGSPQSSSPAKSEPPMPWKKAIRPDYIISFEDGKHYKSMKRHLTTRGMSPQQYREKWGLPREFPMVAPEYAARRSEMAKKLGLGQARKGKTGAKKGGGKRKAAA